MLPDQPRIGQGKTGPRKRDDNDEEMPAASAEVKTEGEAAVSEATAPAPEATAAPAEAIKTEGETAGVASAASAEAMATTAASSPEALAPTAASAVPSGPAELLRLHLLEKQRKRLLRPHKKEPVEAQLFRLRLPRQRLLRPKTSLTGIRCRRLLRKKKTKKKTKKKKKKTKMTMTTTARAIRRRRLRLSAVMLPSQKSLVRNRTRSPKAFA